MTKKVTLNWTNWYILEQINREEIRQSCQFRSTNKESMIRLWNNIETKCVKVGMVRTSGSNKLKLLNIGVARIFDWGITKPQTPCNDVIGNFERGIFCGGKDIVQWKIRRRGLVLARN